MFPYIVFKQIMGKNLQSASPKLKILLLHYSKKFSKNMVSHTNLSDPILHDITVKSNVLTEKTMSIFMLHTLSILLMILKNNLLFTTENTIISLCVLFTGIPLLITLILSYSMANFSNSLFVTHH